MGFLFSGPKPSLPKVPPAPPIPEVGEEAGVGAARKAKAKSGFRKTLLAGPLETLPTGKKTLLG